MLNTANKALTILAIHLAAYSNDNYTLTFKLH